MVGQHIAAVTIATKAIRQRVLHPYSSTADQQHGLAIQFIAAPLVLGAALMSTVEDKDVYESKSMV
jgi:hypothetical protein